MSKRDNDDHEHDFVYAYTAPNGDEVYKCKCGEMERR